MSASESTERHVRQFFSGHLVEVTQWPLGPAKTALPDLHILEVAPGPRLNQRSYVTAGAWQYGMRALEFLGVGEGPASLYVELLTMIAHYSTNHRLGMGHTIPIGRPLSEGSSCEYVYLSLPYLFGPDLEVHEIDGETHQILWALPITRQERELLLDEGLDALEERFESKGVEYWSPLRPSVA